MNASARPFWAKHLRREVQYLLDLGVLAGAFALAYALRFDFAIPADYVQRALVQLPLVLLLQLLALIVFGVYSFIWRYVGMREMLAFVWAAAGSLTPLVLLRLLLPANLDQWKIPLSILLIDAGLAFGGILGLRVLRRGLWERYERDRDRQEVAPGKSGKKRALLVGAGQAGILAARELARQGVTDLDIVGFVDDDEGKQGSVIHGIRVIGATSDLPELIKGYDVDQVVITMARAPREAIRNLMTTCRRLGVTARIMPALYEILEGRVNVSRFRELSIEDLLGREAVKLEEEVLEASMTGRCVLVTGAGGSIGSELARQAARFGPSRLVLVERSEPALFEVDRDLRRLWPALSIESIVADCCHGRGIREVLERCRPAMVVHAAAHKHVPLMEANPTEAIANNSLGTWRLGMLAGEAGVERFVLVSTDKAVRPTSVMGASKRVAELFIQELESRYATSYVAVRFGNVLGSTGSVVPIFQEQIEAGGPVTVTHPEMKRYFMTIPEAAQLVLQAGVIGEGGEIFLLDMGDPVLVVDLARDMIRLAGLEPEEDIDVVFTGIRPGEKLFEELGYDEESMAKTRHPKIFVGQMQPYARETVEAAVARFEELVSADDEAALREYLRLLLPESRLGSNGTPASRASGELPAKMMG